MQIAPHLPKIINLISSHATVSIVAPTGSGKSVGIPAAVLLAKAKCFVTVPTRTAAISLAEYQRVLQRAADPKSNVNKLVGYAAEGNVNYGPETMIAYVTGGHARRKMLSYFSKGAVSPIDFCDVLFVDEVHSGSLDGTIIISLWMTAAAAQVRVPRLVIASATPVPMIINPEPEVYTVDLAKFPIEYRYLNKDIDIDDPAGTLYTDTAKLTANIHRDTPIDSGHILVFASGSAEVENIAAALKEALKDPNYEMRVGTHPQQNPPDFIPGKKVDIIPAFGALKQEDIALIYKATGPDERKIVIATNIAEMSITIEGVGHVVDTMVEKRAETSQSGGFRLTTHYISKDSATQRAGRTGRTRPGVCYRMCTRQKYESLEDHRPPEIERVPIYETVMELLDVGLVPENVIRGIDAQRIINAVYLLERLKMVTKVNGVVTVTESGHFAPDFPLSVRNAAFLWKWIQSGYHDRIFPGIVVAALIDCYGPSYFWIPRRKPDQMPEEYNQTIRDYKQKYFAKYLGYNDLETSLNMWSDLTATIGGIHGSQRTIINWSRDNSINNKKIRELLMIVEQSVNAATRLGYKVDIGPFTTQGVMTAARPLLLSVYSDMTLIQRRDITYFNPKTKEDYRLDNRDAVNQMALNPPPGVIALVTAEIKTQRGIFRVIGFGVDTDKDSLGRPIVLKTRPMTPRGPRTITHPRQPATAVGTTTTVVSHDVNQALDLLATLNLGGTIPVIPGTTALIPPTTIVSPTTTGVDAALNLLATLNLDVKMPK
ncbi:ATP-dependent helicase [uncultured virus]|nr:ATP-dependent helicase [uncultured virus]